MKILLELFELRDSMDFCDPHDIGNEESLEEYEGVKERGGNKDECAAGRDVGRDFKSGVHSIALKGN